MLGLPVTEIERLWDQDRHWIYRAMAANQAERLARPIREDHEEQKRKEAEAAAKERERAAIRESKRQMWRNRHAHQKQTEPEAIEG